MAETSNSKLISKINIDNEDYFIKDEKARGDLSNKFGGASYDDSAKSLKFYPSTTKTGTPLDTVDVSSMTFDDISIKSDNSNDIVKFGLTDSGNASNPELQLMFVLGDNDPVFLPLTGDTTILTDDTSFRKVYYNSQDTRIEFYSGNTTFTNGVPASGSTPICTLDASAFIKDAMVSSVEISNGNLVITWNSDSGISTPTSIPLTSIFNPSNYYDKDAVDGLIAGVVAGQVSIVDNLTTNDATKALSAKQGKVLQDNKAEKSEMSVTAGTGADADKTTIQLKSGTSATVLTAHQDISGKQETLVSGTNIKTIDGTSILGSGNINKVVYGKLTSGSFYKGTRGSGGTWTYSNTAETAAVSVIYIDVNANPPKAYCWDGSYKELSITVDSSWIANSTNPVQSSVIKSALDNKVDKNGTDSLMTADEHTKLSGIAAGAEVNVQSDWNQTNTSADDFIKNKPTIPTSVSALTNDVDYLAFVNYDSTNERLNFTTSPSAS